MPILRAVLTSLPKLTSLQILSCIKVDHGNLLNFLHLVPNLRRLAFSVWVCNFYYTVYVHVPYLRPRCAQENCVLPSGQNLFLAKLQDLVIDTRETVVPPETISAIWSKIIGLTKRSDPLLQSLTFKIPAHQDVSDEFIERDRDSDSDADDVLTGIWRGSLLRATRTLPPRSTAF